MSDRAGDLCPELWNVCVLYPVSNDFYSWCVFLNGPQNFTFRNSSNGFLIAS